MESMDGVAFITGTSSGFGLLTSIQLASDGYRVVASMREPSKGTLLTQLATEAEVSDRISIVQLDVSNELDVESVILRTIEQYGKIDVLINNAGIGGHGFVEEIPLQEWRRTFETNFFGALACIRAVLPHMRTRKSGTIVNVGSIGGRLASPGAGPYSASKFALEALSESLRLEMVPFGVKVCIVEPGAFKTDMWKKAEDIIFFNENSPYANGVESIRTWAAYEAENSADPMEVVRVIQDILASEAPTLRYPVGRMANQNVGDFIQNYLTTSWDEIERMRLR